MKRGQFVTYETGRGMTFRAIIRRLHRDGSVSVEPFFEHKNGRDIGPFWGGFLVRLHREDVMPCGDSFVAAHAVENWEAAENG